MITDLSKLGEDVYCPYCNKKTKLVDSSVIYGKSYGLVYLCTKCKAYVGVHKGTTKPLGTPASKNLRALRRQVHSYLDELWLHSPKSKKSKERKNTYAWLSKQLNIPIEKTHVGMFNESQCIEAIELLREELIRRNNL